ncbi:hypothetical protein ACOBR2_02505 [Telmatobacter bradus]|uniref:hypothetical protein n=1 Tax=Telmatobacter bradus TaxID=474953 RepID=UPI003B431A23
MKFSSALVAVSAVLWLSLPVRAQSSHDLPPPPVQDGQTESHGKVIFSRSTDENGQTTTQTALPAAAQAVTAPIATDAERAAITFTAYDMDVRLRPSDQQIAVRALLTVRNDGKAPLNRLPLQLSSSLNWERVRVAGRNVSFPVATLNSDVDHTGQLHEAAVPLATPLASGASLQIDVTYSGTIQQSAQRLMAIGTPDQVALHSDWDQIGVEFTGLRGFGNVVWYPVASVASILGDGAKLFDEMGEHKMRLAGADFRLRLTDEFPHGHPPTVALINGHSVPLELTTVESVGPEVNGVATATLPGAPLGFDAPSLFVAERTAHPGTNTTFWVLPASDAAVSSWAESTAHVTPFLQGWLGQRPRAELTVLDLPDPEDAPFETGALLATSVRIAAPEQLDGILAHALTHAWMQSPRAWLSEGVAHFMGTLWLEKQRGRQEALESLESTRNALALAEPSSPGVAAGQPLAQAIAPIYYRTKATYVLWMLRDVASDATLSAALRAYNPQADVSPGYGHDNGPSPFQKLLEQAGSRANLDWFFADWVNNDHGLPDLTIESVYPSTANAGNWLVSVNIANAGYAAAEVPVTVRSDTASVTQRVLVPAHGKAVQRLLIQGRPVQIQVNDGTVPEAQASIHLSDVPDNVNTTPAVHPGPVQR